MKTVESIIGKMIELEVDELVEFQDDLKTLDDENYEKLKQQILKNKIAAPPFVWKTPEGTWAILDAHQRKLVLTRMRDKEGYTIPKLRCVEIEASSREQAKELVLAYNAQFGKMTEKGLFDFIQSANISFDTVVGSYTFPGIDFDGMRMRHYNNAAQPEAKCEEDSVPDQRKATDIQRGDLFLLGPHRLMCGDSTDPNDVDRLMGGEQASLIFTDPPWNVNYGDVEKGNDQGYVPRKILNDHMDEDKWLAFCQGFCYSLFRSCKPGCPIYMVMSPQEWPVIDKVLREAGFHWSSTVIWAKDRLVLSRKDYHTQYEPIWYGWHGGGPRLRPVEDRTQTDLWQFQRPSKSELHPTTKPVELIEKAINNSSLQQDLVLDLFGGSGSTLVASHKTNRRCFSMELDPMYVQTIVDRYRAYTGSDDIRRIAPGEGV